MRLDLIESVFAIESKLVARPWHDCHRCDAYFQCFTGVCWGL